MKFAVRILIAAALAIGLFSSELIADDFRLLLVSETGVDPTAGMPAGRIVVNGGFLNGVETGMTGTVWRKNKIKGQIDIADLEVVALGPYDATCAYVMRHPDFRVLKKDRAAIETVAHDDAAVLGEAIAALDGGRCFDALLLFERIYCANLDNGFVTAKVNECLAHVKERLSGGSTTSQASARNFTPWEMVDIAEGHNKRGNVLAADMYLTCAFASSDPSRSAESLRRSIPTFDLAQLMSSDRCDRKKSGAVGHDPLSIPVERMPEMTLDTRPEYPPEAMEAGTEGTVWIRSYVNVEGKVTRALVYKSSGSKLLDDAALDAAPLCRFTPAVQGGSPVAVWVTYKVEFTIE